MRSRRRLEWVFVAAAAVTILCFTASCKATGDGPPMYAADAQYLLLDEDEACDKHLWGEWEREDPTCTGDGYATRQCSVCGETEEYILRATGHTYSSEWREAENADTGDTYMYRLCDVCGEVDLCDAEESAGAADDEEDGEVFLLVVKIVAVAFVSAYVAVIIAWAVWSRRWRKRMDEEDEDEESSEGSEDDTEGSEDADTSDGP